MILSLLVIEFVYLSESSACIPNLWHHPPAMCASVKNGSNECSCPIGQFCPAPNEQPVPEADETIIDRQEIVALAELSFDLYNITQKDASSTFLVEVVKEMDLLGAVTVDADNSSIIVAFRGTQVIGNDEDFINAVNLLTDITGFLVYYPLCTGCNVHLGFLMAYNSLATQMKADVKLLQSAFPNATKLLLTGHSLGGAMATLLAVDLAVNEGMANVSLVTFGSPRVGDAAFAAFANAHIGGVNWRVTYDNDIISVMMPISWGYTHVGAELHYVPSDGGHYFLLPAGLDVDYSRENFVDHFRYTSMTY